MDRRRMENGVPKPINVARTPNKQQIRLLQHNTRKLSDIVHNIFFIKLRWRLSARIKYKVTYERFVF